MRMTRLASKNEAQTVPSGAVARPSIADVTVPRSTCPASVFVVGLIAQRCGCGSPECSLTQIVPSGAGELAIVLPIGRAGRGGSRHRQHLLRKRLVLLAP